MKISTLDLKKMLVEVFSLEQKPEDIGDDSAIIGQGLGLDSVDALEIIALANRRFGANIKGRSVKAENFKSIGDLTNFINSNLS